MSEATILERWPIKIATSESVAFIVDRHPPRFAHGRVRHGWGMAAIWWHVRVRNQYVGLEVRCDPSQTRGHKVAWTLGPISLEWLQ